MMILLLVIFLVSLYALYRVNRRHMEKYAELMPGEKAYPIIGNLHTFYGMRSTTDLIKILNGMVEKFREKKLIRFWFGPLLFVLVWDNNMVELIANHLNSVNKSGIYSMVLGDAFSGVFVTNGGPKVKELRKPLMKTFNKKFLQLSYHQSFVEKSKLLVQYLRKYKLQEEINVLHLVGRSVFDIFSETHLGLDTQDLKENQINYVEHASSYATQTFHSVMTYGLYIWRLVLLYTGVGKKWRSDVKALSRFHEWVLTERQKIPTEGKGDIELYPDFLLRRGVENKLTTKELGKELGDVILGGTDTMTVVISSCLLYLSMFPEIQEKVYQEQFSIFGNSSRDAINEDNASMKYLEMVIKETLRLVSAPGLLKECTGDIQLGEYKVPKGSILYIVKTALHEDPHFWEKPLSFYPEHFLSETEASRPHHTYIPFGVGPRACPGAAYAISTIKVVISTVIRHFKLSTSLKFNEIKYDYNFLRIIRPGHYVTFYDRI